jgi:hypothetical protein
VRFLPGLSWAEVKAMPHAEFAVLFQLMEMTEREMTNRRKRAR